jgi:class 3 adenylate cyclase
MTLKTDLETYAYGTFLEVWKERDGYVVPSDTSVTLSNDAVNIDATVLYADLADSTVMVDTKQPQFAAEVYKTFLYCAVKVIRSHSGEITAYDGDRVMAVFIGEKKNTRAVKAALQINWAVKNIVQAKLKSVYKNSTFTCNHVVGIDTSKLLVAKTGIRGSNDLVWVGRAANHAAKLSSLPHARPTYISADIYKNIDDEAKTSNGKDMWTALKWNTFDDRLIYGSNYWWSFA